MNKHLDDGRLLAYLDGQMDAQEATSVQTHLNTCDACRAQMAALRATEARVADVLDTLAPSPLAQPDKQHALASFQSHIDRRQSTTMLGRMMNLSLTTRRVAAGVAALALVIGLFTLAPVRALASDFLGLFRVESFVVVGVDPGRIEQIAEAMDEDMHFGTEEMIEPPGEPVEVASVDEAAELAGFTPRVPAGRTPDSIQVMDGQQVRYTPDVETLRAVFVAMDLDPTLLPDEIDGEPFDFSIPASVAMTFDDGDPDAEDDIMVMQMPSPSVEGPDTVDMDALGKAMLQLLGMSEREAERLSASIDWATTMVLPLPTDIAQVQEVSVNGQSGLLFDRGDFEDADGAGGALLWQEGGIVTMVTGSNSSLTLLEIAGSLQ